VFNVFDFAGCHKDEENLNVTSAPTHASSGSNCWILAQQNARSDDQFFNRDWNSYSEGFGDASGNFWIGNKHLHLMTQLLNHGLPSNLPSFVIRVIILQTEEKTEL